MFCDFPKKLQPGLKKRNPHARQDTTVLLHGIQCKECIQVIYIAPKEHLHLTGMMFVRTHVRTSGWENVVYSISRGINVTNCWNLVCACNKYYWWCPALNIPRIHNNRVFSECSIFLWEFDYFTFWVALIWVFPIITFVFGFRFLGRYIVNLWSFNSPTDTD